MKSNFLLLLLLIVLIIEVIEAKKRKLKIGKKAKRLFVGKKHHNKNKSKSTTVSVSKKLTRSSIRQSLSSRLATVSLTSIPQPTATTFSTFPTFKADSEVYITLTDRNYNYFLGYPTLQAGVNYFRNQRFMIAGRRPCGGCCDNKIIIVTRAPDERIV